MGTPFVKESPIQDWVEDEDRALVLTIPGAASVTGTPTVALYNEETNVSSTCLGSTNGTTNGINNVTVANVKLLKGGQTYVLLITAVVDSATKKYKCVIGPVAFPYGAG